jgi:GH24 family phage-related lysozyme (muramidase)
MKDIDINTLRNKHVTTFYNELSGMYKKTKGYTKDFDGFPESVQKALFDMIFNLGQTKLHNTFTNFNKAIKKEKWDEAAKQCNRPEVNVDRNNYVKGLFKEAHMASQKATTLTSQVPKI